MQSQGVETGAMFLLCSERCQICQFWYVLGMQYPDDTPGPDGNHHLDNQDFKKVVDGLPTPDGRKLKSTSIRFGYLLFAIIGFGHTLDWQIILVLAALYSGISGLLVMKWLLLHPRQTFNQYRALFFEVTLYAVAYVALGWVFRWTYDYLGWHFLS